MVQAYPGLPGGALAPDFGGDYAFWYPCVAVAERHARYAPVYFYRFDVAPRLMRWAGLDATHGLELFALFEQADAPLARRMTSLGGRKVFSSAGERMRDAWLLFADVGSAAGVVAALRRARAADPDHRGPGPRRVRPAGRPPPGVDRAAPASGDARSCKRRGQAPPSASDTTARACSCTSARCSGPRSDSA